MADIPHLSLVILCYRAGESIAPFVERAHRMLSQCAFAWELVLVGNYIEGSGDSTPAVLHAVEKRLSNVRVIAMPKKGMMGWDMKSGMNAARGEFICVIDGDGQFPIESVVSCLFMADLQELDFVKTYRVRRDDGVYRRLISIVYNLVFRILFRIDVHDANSKPKLLRKSSFQKMTLRSNDWFLDAEIMIQSKKLNLKVGELPVHFSAHSVRASFIKPQAILEFLKNLFGYWWNQN